MIRKCGTDEDVRRAVNYIGEDYMATPYLYADIIKYGTGTSNVIAWMDMDCDEIQGLYLLYFDCLHFYTKNPDNYNLEEIIKMRVKYDPKVIMVPGKMGDLIEDYFDDKYSLEKNYVLDMRGVGKDRDDYKGEIACREDIEQIVDLMMTDELYQSVFSRDILMRQMLERFDDGFSRYIVIKDANKVISTCSTYGEIENIALIGSVIVHPDYRRRGLAAEVEGYTGRLVSREGKVGIGFVNYENYPSLNLHEQIGCKRVASLYKFVRIDK